MKKKGLSHIEFILAFILFAGVTSATFYFFSPFPPTRAADHMLRILTEDIDYGNRVAVTTYLLNFDNQGVINITITDSKGNLWGIPPSLEVRAWDGSGNALRVGISNNANYERGMVYIDASTAPDLFAYFSVSEAYNPDYTTLTAPIPAIDSEVESISTRLITSEKRVDNLGGESSTKEFRKTIRIPPTRDFNFTLVLPGTASLGQEEIKRTTSQFNPSSLREVSVREQKMEVVRSDGNIVFGTLRTTLW